MKTVFLSPSSQEFNMYLTGENEEEYMNILADKIEYYFTQNNIGFDRNSKAESFLGAIERSNRKKYDLHLALHSNASGPELSGQLRGPVIFYFPESSAGKCASEIVASGLREIYPRPDLVSVLPSYTLAEVRRTSAPVVYVEVGYHDNAEDERWIKDNLDLIAENISRSVIDYLENGCAKSEATN